VVQNLTAWVELKIDEVVVNFLTTKVADVAELRKDGDGGSKCEDGSCLLRSEENDLNTEVETSRKRQDTSLEGSTTDEGNELNLVQLVDKFK
jgi:hypothetical protein